MWSSMSSEELDRQYSPSQWNIRCSPDEVIEIFFAKVLQLTAKWRTTLPCELGIYYGDSKEQRYDWFWPLNYVDSPPTGMLIYIHGGYWQAGSLDGGCEIAGAITDVGLAFVGLGHDLAPNVTLRDIVNQVYCGLKDVLKVAKKRRITEVYLGGHSSGAHLAALVLANSAIPAGQAKLSEEEMKQIKGTVLLSGVFDLAPINRVPSVSSVLGMTKEDIIQLSPLNYALPVDKRVFMAWGSRDTDEFKRQSLQYANHLKIHGLRELPTFVEVDNCDHFELLERLDEKGFIMKRYLENFFKTK